MTKPVPTLSDWLGGSSRLHRVVDVFYGAAAEDPLLAPLFRSLGAEHRSHVARFIDEVFGGPKDYSEQHGGHLEMVRRHVGKHITEEQRQRWMQLWLRSADECGVPDDPEFRSALVSYLEWGSRLARINSGLEKPPSVSAEMPKWGWGEVGGPYIDPNADDGANNG